MVPAAGFFWRVAKKTAFSGYKPVPPKPERPQTLLVFSDENHLELLLENLWTLANSWHALPRLVVVGDLKAKEAVFRKALHWWPHEWDFMPYEQIEQTFMMENRSWLVEFGRYHIFGRKLAAILHFARQSPTLYCDSDVLWLGEPAFLDRIDPHTPGLLVSVNPFASYCEAMIDSSSTDLMQPPFACAGLLYVSQWPWPEMILKEWVNRAMTMPPHPLAEQTIFGFLVRHFGGYIPNQDVALFLVDRDRFLPINCRPAWSARHYVTPVRYHFHRDALLMRLGIIRRKSVNKSS